MNTHALDPAEVTSNRRIQALLVDDSPFMLKILSQILREAGSFDLVGSATNGHQALTYVSTLSPDLVVIDVHMPGLNGIHATRYMKQREHPPVVIIVTSDESPVTTATAAKAGADGFVSKDRNVRQQLTDVLQNLFGPRGAGPEKVGGISLSKSAARHRKKQHDTCNAVRKTLVSEASTSPWL